MLRLHQQDKLLFVTRLRYSSLKCFPSDILANVRIIWCFYQIASLSNLMNVRVMTLFLNNTRLTWSFPMFASHDSVRASFSYLIRITTSKHMTDFMRDSLRGRENCIAWMNGELPVLGKICKTVKKVTFTRYFSLALHGKIELFQYISLSIVR